MPEISVIMPARNAEAFVADAIRSILGQDFRDLELVVVDDASSDGTAAAIRSFRDPRVRLLTNEAPLGVAQSLNRALDAAAAPLVARMDADDLSEPRRLSRQADFLRLNPALGLCGSWIRCFGSGRPYVLTYPTGPDVVRASMLFDNPLPHPAVCLRRDSLDRHGLRYDPTVPAAQDFELWARCADRFAMDNIPEALLRYRIHPGSVSQARQAVSDDQATAILRRELERLGISPTPEEMRFHRMVGHGAGMVSRAELLRAESWLDRLVSVNAATRVHPDEALRKAAAFAWFRVCMNSAFLGPWVWLRHRRSSLHRFHRPTRAEAVTFALMAGRALAGARGRGPTGRLETWSAAGGQEQDKSP